MDNYPDEDIDFFLPVAGFNAVLFMMRCSIDRRYRLEVRWNGLGLRRFRVVLQRQEREQCQFVAI